MSAETERTTAPTSLRLASRLVSALPHGFLYAVSRVAGLVHFVLAREKRRHYLANTAPAVHFSAGRRPWLAFQNQALNVLELVQALGAAGETNADRVSFEGVEHVDGALERGRGLVIATFHFGNWELAGLALARRGYPVTTVAGEQLRPSWSPAVKDFKRRFGIDVIDSGDPVRRIYRALEANRIVALHIDGNVFRAGAALPFLGKEAVFARGPARLSRSLGSPITLAYCRRTGRSGLHLRIDPPAEPPRTAVEEMCTTESLVRRIEQCVLEEPGQWCIFRKL